MIQEKEVKKLETEISKYIPKKKVVINTPKDMEKATEMLSILNKYSDQVTEKKESVTKPLNAALKAARELFKPLEAGLEEGIDMIRGAMTIYQTEKKKIADIEEAKIAARTKPGKGNLSLEKGMEKMDQIEKPAESITTENGAISFMTVKKFEVMDITLLPHTYILPDEVAIRKAMKEGVELPGVKYWEEQVPKNTR